jgi:hypothetical protein
MMSASEPRPITSYAVAGDRGTTVSIPERWVMQGVARAVAAYHDGSSVEPKFTYATR